VLLKSADGRQIATASFLIAPSKLRVQLEGVRCSVEREQGPGDQKSRERHGGKLPSPNQLRECTWTK
jgi:hypothetical protein